MAKKKDQFKLAEDLLKMEPVPANVIERLDELREDVEEELRPLFDYYYEAAEAVL